MFDLIEVDQLRAHTRHFILWPRQWQTYQGIHPWTIKTLHENYTRQIPVSSGIYTLILEPGIAGHNSCSYLMYVGKTSSLRRRFGDYLRKEREESGRPRISEFLTRYDGYVYFCYTLVEVNILNDIENKLLEAYIPPLNSQYQGEISRVVGAF